ncbi:glycine betaine ABC transporter substrate-binding protein [uncultured Tateyamaria sp.]|uniref:glycine betaine ABC transporter substrate-binding protein n=1 Tax=uncultured Tateyamaria sp. TaxID=455651 RepID=UPI002615605E|nr:glycine betaine ABC transporter substrate-binding protein [uncultured Tateyamaria sp.]
MNKFTLAAAGAMTATILSVNAAHAECGDVTITDMDWASSQVVTAVSKFLMEQGLGCNVTAVPSATNTAMVSLAENGTPDIVTEIWGNSVPAVEKLQDEGKALFHSIVLTDGGQQGWWVPQYMVDENPELATLDGILANADLFDGRLFTCPDGWVCKNINANIAKAAGLEEAGIDVFDPGSGEALSSSLAAAYAEEEPWLGYYWAPTALLGKNPMVMVDMGSFDKAGHECNIEEDCANPVVSPYPRDEVWTIITPAFKEREPAAAELMGNVAFTNPQMGQLLAWREENNASADETAAYFLLNYQDVWAEWLSDEAKANLSELLK